jgi:hypothetical protein
MLLLVTLGMTFFGTITVRGIEFSQSLCNTTFQDCSGLLLTVASLGLLDLLADHR